MANSQFTLNNHANVSVVIVQHIVYIQNIVQVYLQVYVNMLGSKMNNMIYLVTKYKVHFGTVMVRAWLMYAKLCVNLKCLHQ